MSAISQEIRIGSATNPTYRWNNAKIVLNSTKGVFSVDVLGNELSIDTFTATVQTNIDAPLAYSPVGKNTYKTRDGKVYLLQKPDNYGQNYLQDIAPETPAFWYAGGSVFAKGYFQSVQRISRHLYKLTCASGIWLLNAKTHFGGLYSGTKAITLLVDIIGDSFRYSTAYNVSQVSVYGHLPFDTARANLHRLLFALGAAMFKDSNGDYVIAFLSNTLINVPQSRVVLGGKTEYVTPADSVEVTEHSFYALSTDEEVSLFDNSAGAAASNQTIIFDDPMHDLVTTGNLSISQSSVNHAVVSGVGTLVGKKYTHNMLIIRQGSGSKNVKRVTSNELISFANSYFVASRVYNYYHSSKKVEATILLNNEVPGQLLALTDSFGDATNAFLSSMEVAVTSLKTARCKLVAGFVPDASGNNFTHKAMLTSSATWVVPSGVTRIRIVLIGGGQGGQGGYDGADGLDKTTDPRLEYDEEWAEYVIVGHTVEKRNGYYLWGYRENNQPPGTGGAAGAAGAKATFLVSDQTVEPNDSISIAVGVGGAGGARNGGLGSAGSPSTATCSRFGTLTSADGLNYEGYNDPGSGITYAVAGEDGTRGGDGGRASDYGWRNMPGVKGGNVKTWSGGNGGAGLHLDTAAQSYFDAGGGGAGGAAVGANGGNGGNALSYSAPYDPGSGSFMRLYVFGGNGGNGANATAPSKPTLYGKGGSGGNGGGGGGNAGGAYYFTPYTLHTNSSIGDAGTKGAGGHGSAGSAGGDGCVIIYY